MAAKLGRVGIYSEELPSVKSRGPFGRSPEILDMLYFYYNKAYGHQTWQGGDLLLEASTHKVTQSFEHMVTLGLVIN